jgi:hypothetical protein
LPWLALVFSVGATQPVLAIEFPVRDDRQGLEQALERAAEGPPDPRLAVSAAHSRLRKSIAELESFLARSGPEASRAWSQWLALDALKAEVARSEPDVAALRKVQERFFRNDPGLEMAAFLAVREPLRQYLTSLDYAASAEPAQRYRDRMEELSDRLVRLEMLANEEDSQEAGAIVQWLEQLSPQGAELAAQVRRRHSRPNGFAQISGRFINSLMEQNVQEQRYLSGMVLGNLTQGPAYTSGHVSFALVPNPDRATLEVRLSAVTSSPANTATRGRISIYSSATTAIQAQKRVLMSDVGLSLLPAAAACRTDARINDIQANRRLIERIAWRRAMQLLPQAEQAAARQAEAEAASGLDERAGEALGGVNDMFCEQIRAPLVRLDALPALWRFWTDSSHLRMNLVQSSDAQLAAAGEPPAIPASFDLAFCGHESMINNLGESMLGGRQIKDQAWLDLMNLLTGAQPRHLWVHDRGERWSVTMAQTRPVITEFRQDRLGISLRLAALTRGDKETARDVEVEARFTLETNEDGPALVREGDVEIRFAGPTDAAQDENRAFLARKFGAVFPQELHFNGLVPPAGGSLGRLRALDLKRFASADGWITVGYQLQSTERLAESAPTISR